MNYAGEGVSEAPADRIRHHAAGALEILDTAPRYELTRADPRLPVLALDTLRWHLRQIAGAVHNDQLVIVNSQEP